MRLIGRLKESFPIENGRDSIARKIHLPLRKLSDLTLTQKDDLPVDNLESLWENRYEMDNELQRMLVDDKKSKALAMNLIQKFSAINMLVNDVLCSTPRSGGDTSPKASGGMLSLQLPLSKKKRNTLGYRSVRALSLLALILTHSKTHIDATSADSLKRIYEITSKLSPMSMKAFEPQTADSHRLLAMLIQDETNDSQEIESEEKTDGPGAMAGKGRHATVVIINPDAVLKKMALSKRSIDITRVYAEIVALETLTASQTTKKYCVPLHRYYLDSHGEFCVEMERAVCNLAEWRNNLHVENSEQFIIDCLRMLCNVADAVQFMFDHGIVHYDLRCENILILQNGEVVLADFGESVCNRNADVMQTSSRGTECIKSPEMLKVCSSGAAMGRASLDRLRSHEWKTNASSDIWSFGCMVFELLCQSYLFDEALTNWASFFARVTCPASVFATAVDDDLAIISKRKRAELCEHCGTEMGELMEHKVFDYILQRDTRFRPSIAQIKTRLVNIINDIKSDKTVINEPERQASTPTD